MSIDQRLQNLRTQSEDILGPADLPRPDLWAKRCPVGQRDKKACNTCEFALMDRYGRPHDCKPTIKRWWKKKQRGIYPLKKDREHDEGN